MTHLTRQDLERWRDDGSPADRERVLGHLGACGQCAAAYAELVRTQPVAEAPAHLVPADFVGRGYDAYTRTNPASRSLRWWAWRVAPLAAAAALLIAVVGPLVRDTESPPVLRGGDARITLVRPVATVVSGDDLVFEWTAAPGMDRARLQVFDLSAPSQPIIQREVVGARYEPTPEERARLPKGTELHWFIETRGDGSATVTSPAATFTVK